MSGPTHSVRAMAWLVAAALGALSGTAGAETRRVELTNGDELYGEVTVQPDFVEVVTISGERRRFPRAEVAEVGRMSRAPSSEPKGEWVTPAPPPVPDPAGGVPGAARGLSGAATDRTPPPAAPPPAAPPPAAPPPPELTPWYDRQKWSLVAVVVCIGTLFAAGVLRREHPGVFSLFRRVRLLLLLAVLAFMGIYAMDLQIRREARTEWSRPLHVAVVLVERGPLAQADVLGFRLGAQAASDHLLAERRRFYPPAGRPFWFHVFGPVRGEQRPISPDEADASGQSDPSGQSDNSGASDASASAGGLIDRLFYSLHLRYFLSEIDDAANLDSARFDARMYVFATPTSGTRGQRFVEGVGESGGDLGMVDVDLDSTMVDAAWIAVAHETLHTLGATDKYTETGRAQVPEGLAEPDRVPPYPQRFAEIMAGEIALSPVHGRLVDRLQEVRVGAATAREIKW